MEMEQGFGVVGNKGSDEQSAIAVRITVLIIKVESNEQKKTWKAKGRQKTKKKRKNIIASHC